MSLFMFQTVVSLSLYFTTWLKKGVFFAQKEKKFKKVGNYKF